MEGTESDTEIVSDLREGDGEMKIIVESTKIGEGREEGEISGEEMKGREARMVGEESGRDVTNFLAWPLLSFGILRASSSLAFGFKLLFFFLVL